MNQNCFYIDNYLDQNRHVLKVLAVPLVKRRKKLKPVTERKKTQKSTAIILCGVQMLLN